MNSVAVLCCCSPITPDPQSSNNSRVSDACSGSGSLATGLRQCSTGWHSSLPGTLSTVSAQFSSRLIYHLHPYDLISDALATLYWLRILEHVQHKVAVLTYKLIHGSAPRYLRPLVAVADLPGQRALQLSSTSQLVVAPIKLSTVGCHAFPVAAAKIWNSLLEAIVSLSSLQTFCVSSFKNSSVSIVLPSPDS